MPRSDIAFFDDTFNNPRTTRFNIGIEKEVAPTFSVGADYVFAAPGTATAARTATSRDRSAVDEYGRSTYDGSRQDGDYNQFQVEESTARRQFNSLVLSARKRFSDDFQFQAFYTLSGLKTDDDNERDSSPASATRSRTTSTPTTPVQ